MPVIAEVPKMPKDTRASDIVAIDAPRSRAAERYRSVRTAVLFALHEHLGTTPRGGDASINWSGTRAPVLMVTSPNPSEGKTTTVANLAAVFADLVPAPPCPRLDDGRPERRLANRMGCRPPAPEPAREHLERSRHRHLDRHGFPHRRRLDHGVHCFFSRLSFTSFAKAPSAFPHKRSIQARICPSPCGST